MLERMVVARKTAVASQASCPIKKIEVVCKCNGSAATLQRVEPIWNRYLNKFLSKWPRNPVIVMLKMFSVHEQAKATERDLLQAF